MIRTRRRERKHADGASAHAEDVALGAHARVFDTLLMPTERAQTRVEPFLESRSALIARTSQRPMVMSSDAVSTRARGGVETILFTARRRLDVVDGTAAFRANVEPSHVSARVARPDDAVGGAVQRAHAVGGGTTVGGDAAGTSTRRAPCRRRRRRSPRALSRCRRRRTDLERRRRRTEIQTVRIARERERHTWSPRRVSHTCSVPRSSPNTRGERSRRRRWQSRETRSPSPSPSRARRTRPTRGRCRPRTARAPDANGALTARCASRRHEETFVDADAERLRASSRDATVRAPRDELFDVHAPGVVSDVRRVREHLRHRGRVVTLVFVLAAGGERANTIRATRRAWRPRDGANRRDGRARRAAARSSLER